MAAELIRDEESYREAMRAFAALLDRQPEAGSALAQELEALGEHIHAYESLHYPTSPATPAETVRFHLERLGWTQAELARRAQLATSHLSAFLGGKRSLSLTQLKKLSVLLEVPIDRLVFNEYREQLAQEDDARPVPHLP